MLIVTAATSAMMPTKKVLLIQVNSVPPAQILYPIKMHNDIQLSDKCFFILYVTPASYLSSVPQKLDWGTCPSS